MLFLVGKAAPLDADRRGQVLSDELFQYAHRLPRTVTVCGLTGNGSRIEHVETLDIPGTRRVVRRSERSDRNHHTARSADEKEVQVVALRTVGSLGLDVNAVDAVEHIEVIDVDRPRKGLHRREDVGHRYTQQLRLVAVDVEIELRNVALHGRCQPREFGTLRSIVHQRVDGMLQILIGRIAPRFEHHLETARVAQAGNHSRRREIYLAFGVTREIGAHTLHHGAQPLGVAVAPRFEDHGQLAARLVGTHAGTGTRDVEHVLYVGVGHQELHRAVGHLAGTFDRRPLGQLQFDGEVALVFLRHETLRHEPVHQPDADQHDAEGGEHAARMFQRPLDHAAVKLVARRQGEVDAAEKAVFLPLAFGTQKKRAHHGAERQRHDGRDDHRHGDGDGELAVELTRNARKETHRDKHGAQYQRHGDQRPAQVGHRLFSSLIGREVLLVHDAVDILHDDDGVVDHDADGEDEPQQRQHVERKPENEHHAEGTDQRDGHGDDRDDRGAPALQREEDHEDHQQQRFEQRLVDMMDRLRDVGRHVERNLVADALGEVVADLLHGRLDQRRHLHGIGSGQHVDIQHGGVPAVDAALGIIGRSFERDTRHVFQADDRPVGVGPHDDVLEFADRRQTPLRRDGDRHVDAVHGGLPQHAGGRLAVLVFERRLQILDRQPKVGQFVGHDPYLHGVITAADVRNAAHAGHAAQHVQHVERRIVRKVDFIELGVGRKQGYGH